MHLFLVHSHTTYLVSKGIINYQRFSSDEIVFVTTRNYQIDEPNVVDLNSEFEFYNNTNYYNFYSKWKMIKKVDSKIDKVIKAPFNVYLPHLAHPFFQILASSPNCCRINIIEEGVNCMSKRLYNPRASLKKALLFLLFNKTRLYGLNRYFRVNSNIDFDLFKKGGSPSFYGLADFSFIHVKGYKKINVGINKEITKNKEHLIPDGSNVLILESIVEQKDLNEWIFFTSLEKLRSYIHADKIFLKFHPYQNTTNRKKVLEILKRKFEVDVLPDSTILELAFIRSTNLNVYGFTSSLLYYAAVFGHKSKSFAELWADDTKFMKFRKYNDFDLEELLREVNTNEK